MTDRIDSHRVAAFTAALLALDRVNAARLLAGDGRGGPFARLIDDMVVPALDDIGQAWEAGDVALSQVYMSARVCEELVAAHPVPSALLRPTQPRIGMAALEDHHLLGKRLVLLILRASGFAVTDYGVRDAHDLAVRAHDDGIDVLLISVLMLRSALRVRTVRDECGALGSCPRLIVGGAPFRFDPNLWREVAADACGSTASDAVTLVRQHAEVAS